MHFSFFNGVFGFHNVCKSVEETFQFKRFLDQGCRVLVRRDRVGLDGLLAAVEILDHGIRRHLQSKGVDGHGQREQHTKYCFFHFYGSLLFSVFSCAAFLRRNFRGARCSFHDALSSSLILYSTARSGCSRSASSILMACSRACIVSRFWRLMKPCRSSTCPLGQK